MPTQANDEADIRRRIEKAVEAIRAMDLEALMPIYATDIVSFDIEPPLQHLGAQAKRKNWTKVFTIYQRPLGYEVRDLAITAGNDVAFARTPCSPERHAEERAERRLLGSMDDGLAQGRGRLAHRARPDLGAGRLRDRQSVAEPAAVSRYSYSHELAPVAGLQRRDFAVGFHCLKRHRTHRGRKQFGGALREHLDGAEVDDVEEQPPVARIEDGGRSRVELILARQTLQHGFRDGLRLDLRLDLVARPCVGARDARFDFGEEHLRELRVRHDHDALSTGDVGDHVGFEAFVDAAVSEACDTRLVRRCSAPGRAARSSAGSPVPSRELE